jgi:hypothetical protein
MGKTTRLTTEIFIERAIKVYDNKYDYSKVIYKNKNTKVCIICPIHGEFEKYPLDFLRGQGCQKCKYLENSKQRKLTTEEFIEKAKKVHGDKYDYSKVEYTHSKEKVCIICPKHGEFWQNSHNHLQGQTCPKCCNHYQYTNEEWIDRLNTIHNNFYNYGEIDDKKYISIICPLHGEFKQSLHNHFIGQGCPECGKIKRIINNTKTTDEFIEKAKKVHGDKYDYSKVEYKGAKIKVCIICSKHGEFWQIPNDHLNGCGCSRCNESKLEKEISTFLINEDISFEYQKKYSWLGKQSLDFYLPDYNIAIECQGTQHYLHNWGKHNTLDKIKKLDIKKYNKCLKNNINIIYYCPDNKIFGTSEIYNQNNVLLTQEELIKLIRKIKK